MFVPYYIWPDLKVLPPMMTYRTLFLLHGSQKNGYKKHILEGMGVIRKHLVTLGSSATSSGKHVIIRNLPQSC